MKVKLVNAHHVKTLPGRKTDILDCQWLQQLHRGNYQDLGMDYYEQRYQQRVINNLQKKALALGFELVPQPEANTVS